ncbi:MAG: hypothetical protein SGILL_008668 [Bacillariaceae sp.]
MVPDLKSSSMCTGNPEVWPVPPVDPNTDLQRVLDRGTFRCGYPANLFESNLEGDLLIDSAASNDRPVGLIVEWFDELAKQVGQVYGKDLTVEWDVVATSQEVLDNVYYGEVDAACGNWSPDGVWLDPDGDFVSRALGFAVNHCPTYIQEQNILVNINNIHNITDFPSLVTALERDNTLRVCTPGSVGGGYAQNCMNTLGQYLTTPVECHGEENEAHALLDSGDCDVLYNVGLATGDEHIVIPAPNVFVAVSMFRYNNEAELRAVDNGDVVLEEAVEEQDGDVPMDSDAAAVSSYGVGILAAGAAVLALFI